MHKEKPGPERGPVGRENSTRARDIFFVDPASQVTKGRNKEKQLINSPTPSKKERLRVASQAGQAAPSSTTKAV